MEGYNRLHTSDEEQKKYINMLLVSPADDSQTAGRRRSQPESRDNH